MSRSNKLNESNLTCALSLTYAFCINAHFRPTDTCSALYAQVALAHVRFATDVIAHQQRLLLLNEMASHQPILISVPGLHRKAM